MKTIIVAAGCDLMDDQDALERLRVADLIISADGGLNYLKALGIFPNVYVGDFDSTIHMDYLYDGEEIKKGIQILEFPTRKDKTDLELALDYLVDEGIDTCTIMGGTGSRLDHSLCNIFMLERYKTLGLHARLINKTNRVTYLTEGTYQISKTKEGWYQSFLAMPTDVTLTLQGFDYKLHRTLVKRGSSLAISNHALVDGATVIVEDGGVYSIEARD